jgi:TolA-binding protein
MSESREPLSKYVRLDLSETRTDSAWRRIQPRLKLQPERRGTQRFRTFGFAVAALAAVAFGVQFANKPADSAWDGTVLETAGGPLSVELHDHSRLELGANSRVEALERTPQAAEFRLARGHVDCDVTPNPGRRFAVLAGGVEILVTGTRFSVDFDPLRATTEVAVSHGTVEVRDASGAVRLLRANERWSQGTPPEARPAEVKPAEPAAATVSSEGVSPEGIVSADEAAPIGTPGPTLAADKSVRGSSADAPKNEGRADAKTLFDEAGATRRRGDAQGAARGYEELLTRFPKDPRVGLAALELARLRMDRLADPAGAVRALKTAIAQAPSPSLGEDARARLVDAYQALGQVPACRAARHAYLNKYPTGIHSRSVETKCGGIP